MIPQAHIHGPHGPAGDLPGLRFDLPPSTTPPRIAVEARTGRLILRIDDRDHLFARIHPHLQGLHLAIAPRASVGALPPIRSDDVRAVDHASRGGAPHAWAAWFVRAIAEAGLFAAGTYAITEAHDGTQARSEIVAGAAPSSVTFLDPVGPCLDEPAASWINWFGDDRDVVRLRTPSSRDASRVHVWRKHARAGTLPPLLLWFVAGLDTCVLLDGHDRLLAATEEGVAARLLVLWRYTLRRRPISKPHQDGLLQELRTRRENPTERRPVLPTDQENALLLEAFPSPLRMDPTTRAVPLRGGAAAFERRARGALGERVDDRFLLGREPEGENTGCSAARCTAELGWVPGS